VRAGKPCSTIESDASWIHDESTAHQRQSLRALIERIVTTHHVFTRDAVAKIDALVADESDVLFVQAEGLER
jgi:hypothetical protein